MSREKILTTDSAVQGTRWPGPAVAEILIRYCRRALTTGQKCSNTKLAATIPQRLLGTGTVEIRCGTSVRSFMPKASLGSLSSGIPGSGLELLLKTIQGFRV